MAMERNLWRDVEIKALLDIFEKERILTMINEKKFRNEQIFRFVESEMHGRGFTKKNYQQIWTKWKFLKSSYVTTTRHNSVPGNTMRTCDYYFLLDRILGSNSTTPAGAESMVSSNGDDEMSTVFVVKQEVEDEPEIETENENLYVEPEIMSTPIISPPRAITPETPQLTNGHLKRNFKPIMLRKQPPADTSQNSTSLNNSTPNGVHKPAHNTSQSPKDEYSDQLSFDDLNGYLDDEPASKKKPLQGNYFRAMKELATNLRQMQRELLDEFFKKQEELMREEHEFQKQQDEILLRSFEEQTKSLLEGARNLITSGVTEMPDIVYINEE